MAAATVAPGTDEDAIPAAEVGGAVTAYVFAYGSLLNPASTAQTLPQAPLADAVGARLPGFARSFDVAFPNDGSQADKAYRDRDGVRPSHVLFANLVRDWVTPAANGVLIPLRPGDMARLARREHRYELIDVTASVRPITRMPTGLSGVYAFLGKAAYTSAADVARGVLSGEYMARIAAGVHHWNQRFPGFEREYHASTRLPAHAPVKETIRSFQSSEIMSCRPTRIIT